MTRATFSQTSPRYVRSRLLAVMAAALLALPGGSGWLVAPAAAQVVATARPAVTVTGSGEASAPAVTASVQLLIGHGRGEFGFSRDASGSGSGFSGEGGGSLEGEGVMVELVPEGTPVAATPVSGEASAAASDEQADAPKRAGRRGNKRASGPLTAESLAPVVAAVAASGGVAPEDITVNLSPLATDPFGPRQENARLELEVAQPTPEGLAALIAAASDAAAANGMVIELAGARYNPGDCAAVEEEAALAAIADARARADRLAAQLGVTLGDVVGASVNSYFSFEPNESGCEGQFSAYSYESSYGGLGVTVPIFDPSIPAEVEVYTSVTISYEIV